MQVKEDVSGKLSIEISMWRVNIESESRIMISVGRVEIESESRKECVESYIQKAEKMAGTICQPKKIGGKSA